MGVYKESELMMKGIKNGKWTNKMSRNGQWFNDIDGEMYRNWNENHEKEREMSENSRIFMKMENRRKRRREWREIWLLEETGRKEGDSCDYERRIELG